MRVTVALLALALGFVQASPRRLDPVDLASRDAAPAPVLAGTSTFDTYNPTSALNSAAFPDASMVGFPGARTTGVEANAIQTGLPSAVPKVQNEFYPLVRPSIKGKASGDFDIFTRWGNLGPRKDLDGGHYGVTGASAIAPADCSVTQVQVFTRHGTRYPSTDSAVSTFANTLLAAAKNGTLKASGELEFLNTWSMKLGTELLNPFGRLQLFQYGVALRMQYGALLNNFTETGTIPVFRTESQDRMIKTMQHLALGFFGYPEVETEYELEIMIEQKGINSTGSPYYVCPNVFTAAGALGTTASVAYTNVALKPTADRLQPFLSGMKVTPNVVEAMMEMCAWETISLGYSVFCELFTEEEWDIFEAKYDMVFYYDNGPGSPVAAAQGKGYLDNLIARLAGVQPTSDEHSANNATLDTSNITFPLGNSIYVDATHEVVIADFLTALNMTGIYGIDPLPLDGSGGLFKASEVVPMSTHLEVQTLQCSSEQPTEQVRFILNGAVLPLENAIAGCMKDPNGLCAKESVISGLKKRSSEIDFDYACFSNYSAEAGHNYRGVPPKVTQA